MKRIVKQFWTALFVLFVLMGIYTFVQAQDKKPTEKPNAEDKLKLTERESQALDGLIQDSRKRADATGALEQDLVKESNTDDRILLLVERWRKAKAAQAEIDAQLNSWWTAVRNRADCQDCTLNQQERRLIKPEPKIEARK